MNGQVVIKLKETMNNRTESGLYKDTTFDVHGKMMIQAEVVAVADKGSEVVMFEIDPGQPKARRTGLQGSEPVYVRNKDIKTDIRIGDRIYFHYLTLENEQNFLGMDGDYKLYKVQMQDVFLSMRPDPNGAYAFKGKLQTPHMHNQYVLGEPYWGTDWEEVEVNGKMVGAKVAASGLITETKEDPVVDHAIINNIGFGIKPYSRYGEVQPGDVVVLSPKCEFVNEVDGKERWVFTHKDIFGILRSGGKIQPVCDNVLIKLKEREYEGNIEVDLTHLPLQNEGAIVSIGDQVDDVLSVGDQVTFAPKRTRVIDDTYAIVAEADIMGVLKYSL